MDLGRFLDSAVRRHEEWSQSFEPFDVHPSLLIPDEAFADALDRLASRLTGNYPFFHPSYAGQMLKPPHPAAVAGYVAAMLVNPNNHALDGGPPTAEMEVECVAELAKKFGFTEHLGHLTSSGTIANLEALFVARETHPGKGIAFSSEAHYTHSRMCQLLGVAAHCVGVDACGRIDLDEVESLARSGSVGTVVLTAGSTGLGAVDRVDEALAIRDRHGVRLHVDAAYGGYFAILGQDDALSSSLAIDPRPWRAIASADSAVVDPHKHGLQPYGCGAVVFADPSVARHYAHDSPYTYYTTGERVRHLGEISLECSRAGAAAAALWVTLQVLPLTTGGMGGVLKATRSAALHFASLVAESAELSLYQVPELDIVAYFPERPTLPEVDHASAALFDTAMRATSDPVFLSLLRAEVGDVTRRHGRFATEAGTGLDPGHATSELSSVRLLRSVLMKPESEDWAARLVARIEDIATTV